MSKSPAAGRASEPTSAQLKELFAQIESGRVSKERLQQFLRGQAPNLLSYPVPVNYAMTVEQLVVLGGYDWVNDAIASAHFPLDWRGIESVNIDIMPIDRMMSSMAVVQKMSDSGLRRPNIKEGLSLGVFYPDLQREGPIAILCEPWHSPYGDLRVPYLSSHGSDRRLFLSWFGGVWSPDWRFAAVRLA